MRKLKNVYDYSWINECISRNDDYLADMNILDNVVHKHTLTI